MDRKPPPASTFPFPYPGPVFPSRPLAQGMRESFRPYQHRENVICFMCGRSFPAYV